MLSACLGPMMTQEPRNDASYMNWTSQQFFLSDCDDKERDENDNFDYEDDEVVEDEAV